MALTPDRVYWFEQARTRPRPALRGEHAFDAAVVGGGMAGLAAAERLAADGLSVAVVEACVCGSGATGRSSGFITPDSELQLADLARRFGNQTAAALYTAARAACDHIRATITDHAIDCDFISADSLYTTFNPNDTATVEHEHHARARLGFGSTFLRGPALQSALNSPRAAAAVRYPGTFGINGAAYAAGLRDALTARGVEIFEHSPAIRIAPGVVETAGGSVRSPRIIVAMDRFAPDLGIARDTILPARAYLLLSEPLPDSLLHRLFPGGPVMVWDTDLIYQYFRPTREGRLLIGGSSLLRTYAPTPGDGSIHRKLRRYITRVLPDLGALRYTHRWHGQIGVTKDILPLAGPAPRFSGVWYAMAGAGLPWSVLAGWIAAELALNPAAADRTLLDPRRAFTTIDPLQPILGQRLAWMLAYLLARHVETGPPAAVARRQAALRIASVAGGAATLAAVTRARAGARPPLPSAPCPAASPSLGSSTPTAPSSA